MCRLPATVIVDAASAARASRQAAEVTHPQIKRQTSAAATRRSMNAAPRPNRARLTHDRRGGSVSDYAGIWGIVASGRDTMVTNKGLLARYGGDAGFVWPYCSTCTFSMVTSPPLDIIWSSTGRNASILSFESTISTITGRSCDSRRILVV